MAKRPTVSNIKHPKKPFDARCIPSYEMRPFARDTVKKVEEYFEKPSVQSDFERWLKEDYSKRPGITVSECYKDILN